MRWLDTADSWEWMLGSWRRVFEAGGVTSEDHVLFASSFGPFLGFWLAFEAASGMGCLCLPGGGMRSAARAEMIVENRVTVICCTPTYAIRLAEAAREANIDLSAARVRAIVAAGEPGASIAATRRHIAHLWNGARVVDHHGMAETGPVTYGCPRREGVLHVIESAYFPEIIDRGDEGELVLTPLGREGSPVLRYRTGDLVRRAAKDRCECGSSELALEGGILGRADDLVVIRGVNVYPGAVENVLRESGGTGEYRVEVRTGGPLLDLHIYIEPAAGQESDAQLGPRLEAALHRAFSLRMPVSVVPAGSLPRFEMKAKRWIRR
jgi:phenylacetate-CoA ligase